MSKYDIKLPTGNGKHLVITAEQRLRRNLSIIRNEGVPARAKVEVLNYGIDLLTKLIHERHC